MPQGTSTAHFLVEFDGVSICEASEVSGVNKKHEPVKIFTGNRRSPFYAAGKFELDVVMIKHAIGINGAGRELSGYYEDFTSGLITERRNFRIVQLDEDGISPVATFDLIRCVPTEFSLDGNKADGKDAAYFTIKLQPEDLKMDLD